MNKTKDLEKLLAATAAGDRSSFASLYTETSAKLFGVIIRILRERQLSEEALQETFLRVWDHAGEYRADKGRPMSWLIAIARNQALDHRRRGRSTPPLDDISDVEIQDIGPGPMDRAHWTRIVWDPSTGACLADGPAVYPVTIILRPCPSRMSHGTPVP